MIFARTALLTVLFFVTCFSKASALLASALPPDIRAIRSANGRFLAVSGREYDNPDGAIRRISRTTYEVMRVERFLNDKDALNAAAPFWSTYWEVRLDGNEGKQGFWPMISDDGKSLVLVAVTAALPKAVVLRIYREKEYKAALIRSYAITDLWTAKEVDPGGKGIFMVSDSTPQWFAGGSFAFSSDCRYLIYRDQWGGRAQIDLMDGSISRTAGR